jgi:hypothetical protein
MKITKLSVVLLFCMAGGAFGVGAQSSPASSQSAQTSAPSAQALVTQLFVNPRFERSYQSGVTDSRAKVMKKFDVLQAEESCPGTNEIAKKYRVALDNMVDTLINRKAFTDVMEGEFASLSSTERIATMKVFKAPQFFPAESGAAKDALGLTAFLNWIDGKDESSWRDFAPEHTKEEKLAGLYAAKRGIATITRAGNQGVREQGPKHYAIHRQQMLAAIDRCIADEEARLKR